MDNNTPAQPEAPKEMDLQAFLRMRAARAYLARKRFSKNAGATNIKKIQKAMRIARGHRLPQGRDLPEKYRVKGRNPSATVDIRVLG